MTVGSDVRAARLAAGKTLDDVAEATRVRRAVLERIEDDDYSLCGGDVYARGHLRGIGRALGVDPEPWVTAFNATHVPAQAPLDLAEQHEVRESRRTPNWTAAMAVALVAVVGFGVWSAVRPAAPGESASGVSVAAGSTADPAPSSPASAAPAPSSPALNPEENAVASVEQVTLALQATTARSWVSVSDSDGTLVYQGILEAGQGKKFRDDTELSLIVGNGGAVAVTVNGRDLGSPGAPGEVVRLAFGPGDPTAG